MSCLLRRSRNTLVLGYYNSYIVTKEHSTVDIHNCFVLYLLDNAALLVNNKESISLLKYYNDNVVFSPMNPISPSFVVWGTNVVCGDN